MKNKLMYALAFVVGYSCGDIAQKENNTDIGEKKIEIHERYEQQENNGLDDKKQKPIEDDTVSDTRGFIPLPTLEDQLALLKKELAKSDNEEDYKEVTKTSFPFISNEIYEKTIEKVQNFFEDSLFLRKVISFIYKREEEKDVWLSSGREVKFVKDPENKCSEMGRRVLVGPDKWRKEREGVDKILKTYDHMVNTREKSLCDRIELTADEVICSTYECVEGCDIFHEEYIASEIYCLKMNVIEKYIFKRKDVKTVEVNYHEGINSKGDIKVLVVENGTEKSYSFSFRSEKEIDWILKDLGPYTEIKQWKGEQDIVFVYTRKEGSECVTYPKEFIKTKYGRVLFSIGERMRGITAVDVVHNDRCPPNQHTTFLKTRDEAVEMESKCTLCKMDPKQIKGIYNLMNNQEKSLCDVVVVTEKELMCFLRECIVACYGAVYPSQEVTTTGVVFAPVEMYKIPLSSIQNIRSTRFNHREGYGIVTLLWADEDTKEKQQQDFVFRKKYRMKDFVRTLKQYAK